MQGSEFRRMVEQTDNTILETLRTSIEGGFDEHTYGDRVGFATLRKHLEVRVYHWLLVVAWERAYELMLLPSAVIKPKS